MANFIRWAFEEIADSGEKLWSLALDSASAPFEFEVSDPLAVMGLRVEASLTFLAPRFNAATVNVEQTDDDGETWRLVSVLVLDTGDAPRRVVSDPYRPFEVIFSRPSGAFRVRNQTGATFGNESWVKVYAGRLAV